MRARPKGGAVGRWARRERAAEAAELSARRVGMRGREARRGRASGGLFTPDFAGSGFSCFLSSESLFCSVYFVIAPTRCFRL